VIPASSRKPTLGAATPRKSVNAAGARPPHQGGSHSSSLQPLLTLKEVANVLRCSERTVERLRLRGELQPTKVLRSVRFTASAVNAYIASAEGEA
jgi:excisionase family DNA binding protein